MKLLIFQNLVKNSYIKFLFGKKLDKPVFIQAHAVSASALKEFKRVGGKLILLNLKKKLQISLNGIKKKVSKES